MATQTEDFIPDDFAERMKNASTGVQAVLEGAAEVVSETTAPAVQVIRELVYDAPTRWFISGTIFGVILTTLAHHI